MSSKAVLVLLTVWAYFGTLQAASLTPCGSDNTFEVLETQNTSDITCNSISSSYQLEWRVAAPLVPEGRSVSNCTAGSPGTCSIWANPGYNASRPSYYSSILSINPLTGLLFVRDGTIICQEYRTYGSPIRNASCLLDIVTPASSSDVQCAAEMVTNTDPWGVQTRCNVSGIYSYLKRYTCRLTITTGSTGAANMTVSTTSESTPTGGNYVYGICDVTVPWPPDNTYYYSVYITPGNTRKTVFISTRPPYPRHNCPKYVQEGQTLTCTCYGSTTAPPGALMWTDNSGSPNLTVPNVQRSHDGTEYTCQVVWNGTVVRTVNYTLLVAYGPDSVTVPTPSTFDTDGSQYLTLTCSAFTVNPPASFEWTRPPSSYVYSRGQDYTFQPWPPTLYDGREFQCRGRNSISGRSKTTSVNITLNYPPSTNPVISNSSPDSHLYKDDAVTLTCTVKEGKPVSATSVTLTCPGKSGARSLGSTEVNSSVTFDRLSDADDGKNCTCTTKWKFTDWYNKTVLTTLFVNAPPGQPVISHPSSNYPPIAGQTLNTVLTCVSSSPGRPAATYTWPATGGGRTGTDSQGRGMLTFPTVSREDNRKIVRCRADNRFTQTKQRVVDRNFTLEVYYDPVITFKSFNDTNDCIEISPGTCHVTEGDRVHFRCEAESNPALSSITWDYGSTVDLNIVNSNHRIHNKEYVCTARTGSLSGPRSPLSSTKTLTVLVKYKPTKTQLRLNSMTSIIVDENAQVNFSCIADGRPTPGIRLINNETDSLYGNLREGDIVLQDRDSELRFPRRAVCQDTGKYTCTPSNSVGDGPTTTASLYVNCEPRMAVTTPLPTVQYMGKTANFSFQLIAYPAPVAFFFTFRGPDEQSNTAQTVRDVVLTIICSPQTLLYKFTCMVTVDDVRSDAVAGYYEVRVENSIGKVDVKFRITIKEEEQAEASSSTVMIAVSAAVVVVVAAAVAGVVVWLWRRHWTLPCNLRKQRNSSPSGSRELSGVYENPPDLTNESGYDDLRRGKTIQTPYTGLRSSEAGQTEACPSGQTVLCHNMQELTEGQSSLQTEQNPGYANLDNVNTSVGSRLDYGDIPGMAKVYSNVTDQNEQRAYENFDFPTSEPAAAKPTEALKPPVAAKPAVPNKPAMPDKPQVAEKPTGGAVGGVMVMETAKTAKEKPGVAPKPKGKQVKGWKLP